MFLQLSWISFHLVASICIIFTLLKDSAYGKLVGGFYSDNGLDQTKIHHIMTPKERRDIRRGISHLLDLPIGKQGSFNDSTKLQDSSFVYMSTIYANSRDHNIMAKKSDIIMAYGAFSNKSKPRELLFDLSETPEFDNVLGAELHLHFKSVTNAHRILVYLRTNPRTAQRRIRNFRLVNSANVSAGFEGWMKINVTAALQHWISHPNSIPKLHLRCVSLDGKGFAANYTSSVSFDLDDPPTQPFLAAFFTEPTRIGKIRTGVNERRKRSIEVPKKASPLKGLSRTEINAVRSIMTNGVGNDEGSIAKELVRRWNLENPFVPVVKRHHQPVWESHPTRGAACRLHGLHVRFSELGFHSFILMPSSFEARYCAGECRFPLKHNLNATKHAIVQTLVNFLHPDKAPPACCAPTQLEPLAVIYRLDNRRIVYRKYRDMIVSACGCQ